MYEQMTYENILQRMLDRIPSTFDKREGSIIYDALAPSAIELTVMYIELDVILKEMFAETASREYLIKRVAERAIEPFQASPAIVRVQVTPAALELPEGSRFSSAQLHYTCTGKVEEGVYTLQCETDGVAGNKYLGRVIPVDYIQGLESITITEIVVPGIDEETEESIRSRFQTKIRKPSTSGNQYDYYNWAVGVAGVGAAKIYPLAGGAGTVKVVIADSDMKAASPALIEQVYNHIEEVRPIGATVSVVSVQEKAINIDVRVKLQNGVNWSDVQSQFQNRVIDYLEQNVFALNYVSLARIGNLLLDIAGVEDYGDLKINGSSGNVSLADEEVAVLGKISLGVM